MIKYFLSALLLVCGLAQADTTANLITGTWNNVTNGSHPNNCCSGGPGPLYDASTNTIHFSYGLTAVHQVQAINNALSGSGVQINGWNWGYDLRNMNGVIGNQNGTDTISVTSFITNSAGQIIQQSDQYYATRFDWTRFSGTETLTNPLTDYGSLGIQFVAKDYGYWAGYYGPQVRNVSLTANYTVDQCSINPRYSPSCPGYNTVWDSGNLTSIYGTSFALNQALGFGNSGVQVHSAIVGFDYNINGQYCSGGTVLGICLKWSDSKVRMQWNVIDPNLGMIAYDDKTISGQHISGTYRNEVLIGRDISTIGNTSISINRTGNASVSNPYIGFTFEPTICSSDPLVNPSCPGYAVAYFNLQCSSNPLYDQSCPGYAQAYFNQQCTANALYNTSCPGYAVAYFNYQCSVNPLYATQCPGYEQAYFDQQCSLNPLYATQCVGYEQAYFDQQCSLDGLYDKTCPNYAEAYALKYIVVETPTTTTVTTSEPTEVAVVSDPVVNNVITTTTTSTTSPTATVQLTAPVATTTTVTAANTTTESTAKETKDDMVSETTTQENTTSSTASSSESNSKSDSGGAKPTARQELAAKRREAAKQAAVAAGTKAAEEIGTATSLEAQVAVQNVVIAAMGFTPGFQAYNVIMPDGVGYKPFTVYNNQKNVDNRRLSRGLTGPSDTLHEQMVAAQWELK